MELTRTIVVTLQRESVNAHRIIPPGTVAAEAAAFGAQQAEPLLLGLDGYEESEW